MAVDGPALNQQGYIRKLRLIQQAEHIRLLLGQIRGHCLGRRRGWLLSLILVHQR